MVVQACVHVLPIVALQSLQHRERLVYVSRELS